MKPPPLLVGASLLFWGWQSGFEAVSVLMAVILEGPRWIKARWDLSDEDFTRIWTFCTLLFLAATVYAFTANEGPTEFRSLFENPSFFTQRNAGTATARTAAALFRWLPMVFFMFAAAQAYSCREGVPIETISLILSRRWKKARKKGQTLPSAYTVNVSYYYFGLCLFAASVHGSEDSLTFFWGLIALISYALWWHRPRRFKFAAWALCFGAAVCFGYFGQRGMGELQGYIGNLNPWWFGNFTRSRHDPTQSRTDLGQVGRLKNSSRIVIRVEATEGAPPPLLREASYRKFNLQTWSSDLTDRDYAPVIEEPPNSGSYQLLRGKTNALKVNIGCYLEGGKALLPLPSGTTRLENLTTFTLAKSPLGAVYNDGPGVVVFDAIYGPGPTIDASPEFDLDLSVPPREQAALDYVIGEIGLSEPDPQKAIKALNTYFTEKFSYATFQALGRIGKTNETPLTRFLLRTHRGHCEYFASAGVLLLRRLNIPARYAVGFAVHEGAKGKFVVRQRDAHAWCLVWDEKRKTWRDVDFTPPSWVHLEGGETGRLQAISDLWSRIMFELSKFRWGQTHLRQYLLIAVVPILLILLYQIIFNSRRRRNKKKDKKTFNVSGLPGLDSEFYRIEKALAQRGLQRTSSEPLSAWLEKSSRNTADPQLRGVLRELLLMHYRYRFDPKGLTAYERENFRKEALACLERLRLTRTAELRPA